MEAKPFLKWAGGKTQLIKEIELILPTELIKTKFTYIEPFVGSGAVLFWMLNNFPNMKKVIINDLNEDLINVYKIIKLKPHELIFILNNLQKEFYKLKDTQEEKKNYFYEKRDLYNERNLSVLEQSALFIFLNRTCFNGLYRVNKNNKFNVPIGSYKNPNICNKENILAVSKALKKVEILCGDFSETIHYADKNSLFYFDPPYKPLNKTSNFNSYAKDEFNDEEQIRLNKFCNELEEKKYNWILSNSDVRNENKDNDFFDELYANFNINRVNAKRRINSNPEKRGDLKELLILNY